MRDALVNKRYFRDRSKITKGIVDKVMEELTFIPQNEQIFSATGCKRVAEKVDYVMVDYDDIVARREDL